MQVPEPVRQAAGLPMFNHRLPRMTHLLNELERGTRQLLGTAGDVLFLPSSGTGAMESAVVNLTSPGQEVVVFEGGTFAQRWTEIARAYRLNVRTVELDWPTGPTVNAVDEAIERYPEAKVFFLTWSESSTGVLADLEPIAQKLHGAGKMVVVDAVSGLAVSPLEMDRWGVDVVVAGSQKGLMVPAGLGVVAVNARAWECAKQSSMPRYYWDWRNYKNAVPFTPALTLMFQLQASLNLIEEVGLQSHYDRRAYVAEEVRKLVLASGMTLYARRPGNGITAVIPPSGFNIRAFIDRLESQCDIQIGAGLGPLQSSVFRIGHVGHVTDEELAYLKESFRNCLD